MANASAQPAAAQPGPVRAAPGAGALVVRMTIVPAVLALAGTHAWRIPRWLDRILPDLDIEGTSLRRPPAPPAEPPHAAEGDYQQRAQRS